MTPNELEERTFRFAYGIRQITKKTVASRSDIDQIVRSSGSVAANYIEANESLGRKDFAMRLRICLKETKETRLWLRMIEGGVPTDHRTEFLRLKDESDQLIKIFSAALSTLDRQSLAAIEK